MSPSGDRGFRAGARSLPRAIQAYSSTSGCSSTRSAKSRAERCYRDVLARRPGEVTALANLAYLLFMHQRYREALAIYDRLIESAPNAPAEVWNNRGVCQKSTRDTAAAEQSFRRALELEPDSPQVLANLGFLLYERMRYDEARPLLRRAHELDPDRLQVAAQLLDVDMQFADWRDFDRRRARLIDAVRAMSGAGSDAPQSVSPFTFLALCDDPSLQRTAASDFRVAARAPGPGPICFGRRRPRSAFESDSCRRHSRSTRRRAC